MRNILFVLLLGILLVGLAYFLFPSANTSEEQKSDAGEVKALSIAQRSASHPELLGQWSLDDVKYELKREEEKDPTGVENFLWRDVYKHDLPVTFLEGNKFQFQKDEKRVDAFFKIKGNDIELHFPSNDGKSSYTTYTYELNKDVLILKREDPLLSEQYTFNKL